jgi:hypothetical protein
MAVVVGEWKNEGALVRVISMDSSRGQGHWVVEAMQRVFGWQSDGAPRVGLPGEWCLCPDDHLRPLRGGPGKDETLSWQPVPTNDLLDDLMKPYASDVARRNQPWSRK